MSQDNTAVTHAPRRSFVGLILVALTVGLKSTKIIAALKLLKFGKPLVTIISMAISAVVYGIWLGPWFGIGLVVMLFIHEMGHVIAMRMKGMDTPPPVFMPMLGAVLFIKDVGDRETEAFIGYGGPLVGTLGALACFAIWPFAEGKTAEILILVSYIGIFLNLFNLIPVSPLDGGRITQVVGDKFKYVGVALVFLYTIVAREPALLIIWILILDAFERMPLWWRPVLSTLLAVAMTILMFAGYSTQPALIDYFDMAIAALFTIGYFVRELDRAKSDDGIRDMRPYPSYGIRLRWFAYYLALVAFGTAVLLYQVQHMPAGVKQRSGVEVTSPQK